MILGEWIILGFLCLLSASLAVLWLFPNTRRTSLAANMLQASGVRNPVFLFDGANLIGLSETGAAINDLKISDWTDLHRCLADEFPGIPADPAHIKTQGEMTFQPIDGNPGRDVLCEWVDGVIRVELRNLGADRSGGTDRPVDDDPVRDAMNNAPYPAFFSDERGRIGWCNGAYIALAKKVRKSEIRLAEPLFDLKSTSEGPGNKNRFAVTTEDGLHTLWYDLSIVSQNGGQLCFAVDINAVVDAEIAQRNFVQTLAKTFAQLSTGLAIFDRNRQLALFNPALIDLTALPADFLSGRPSVSGFFDRLRDQKMMPEPKNYGGWRQQMNDLLEAAADGRYQETWSLPSGSVYSVSGRPHPDGAVAFLIEDITAEITLTRRFRSELEMVQSVLDRSPDGIVVFSPDGTLAYSNETYDKLFDVPPDAGFGRTDVLSATRVWQARCAATPVWGEIRDFVELRQNRAEWTAQTALRCGEILTCTIGPIQNGATLVRFSTAAQMPLAQISQHAGP
ncbi:MAG: PAS-domain containing protein [Pseudomonadota bacterium]